MPLDFPKIIIEEGTNPRKFCLLIDGQEIKGVRSVTFNSDVNGLPTLTVDMYVSEAHINGEAVVDITTTHLGPVNEETADA